MHGLTRCVGRERCYVATVSRDRDEDAHARPFPDSLCHRCRHSKQVGNRRGSVFLMCRAHPAKYLPQPVRACGLFAALEEAR